MSFARIVSGIALAAFLSGCAVPSTYYPNDPPAKQALAKCRAQSDERPAPTPNPFGAVADQNQYVVDCMKAAGYKIQ